MLDVRHMPLFMFALSYRCCAMMLLLCGTAGIYESQRKQSD